MNNTALNLIDTLQKNRTLTTDEYLYLIDNLSPDVANYALQKADFDKKRFYENKIFIRGLIEVSNVCKNNCYYCGIRRSNNNCSRYTLSKAQILECCELGYSLGFRTFVLQGGENKSIKLADILDIIKSIKARYPDCAVTLSLGEYTKDEYQQMYNAGADRYLLRHETADKEHYQMLHPKELSFENRFECLYNLKEIGFQTGCGFMVGSPYQKNEYLAKDLKFIERFQPEMCGVGPFIPHKDTPFKDNPHGSTQLTTYLLSLIRLIKPNILLPTTTALNSISSGGRERGILAGANVIMPNLSPVSVRDKYLLYNGKVSSNIESAQNLKKLKDDMQKIGYEIVTDRGDIKINEL